MRGPWGGRPTRIMIEFQRGAFRVFTGCTEFRRGREGIPRREGQFRFHGLLGSFDSLRSFPTPSFIPGAPRGIYSDYFIATLLSSAFKGNPVNADSESMLLADGFSIKKILFCTVIVIINLLFLIIFIYFYFIIIYLGLFYLFVLIIFNCFLFHSSLIRIILSVS